LRLFRFYQNCFICDMFYHDLHEEIRYLKSRLLYKTKKLDEAVLSKESEERIVSIKEQIKDIEQKLQICTEELRSQEDGRKEDWENEFK
jgi:hypothetical protein